MGRNSRKRLISHSPPRAEKNSNKSSNDNVDEVQGPVDVNNELVEGVMNMEVDDNNIASVLSEPVDIPDHNNDDEEAVANLSLCDASFSAADSVPTSGHTRISKCTEGLDMFLEAVSSHYDKEIDFDFEESLGILTGEEMTALWTSLNHYTATSVLSLVEGDQVNEHGRAGEIVTAVVMVGKLCIPLPVVQDDGCPQPFIQTALLLHSVLPNLKDTKMINIICVFLEGWYSGQLQDRDSLTSNTLVCLLKRSVSPQGTKADVKRIWNLHQTVLGFRLGECAELQALIVSTIGSSLYLNTPEGVRWLVFLFSLNPELIPKLHKQVKLSMPSLSASKANCEALGEVYQKAWLASGGIFRAKIEEDCIQDLMYRGVLGNRCKGGMAVPVLRILSVLHKQKRSPPTQSMLSRLYEPILWRHLKVANSMVRLNACDMFLSCYPIEDQELSREERDNSLEMQHTAMLSLMRDENPAVRCAAIGGVCSVLASYWLLIPSDTINQVVSMLIKESVWDSSNARVRVVTLTGIKTLLSSPHSHVYLKVVLPRLSDCMHDTNESVRAAMLDLLLAVKGVRSIKFWNICPLDQLLARLEVDKPFVCRRIVKLLFNSYFPVDQGEEVTLERCIHLVQTNRGASRRFYQYCGEMLDIPGAVKLMVAILTSVKIWVKARLGGRGQEEDEEDKENSGRKRRKLYNSSMMSDNSDMSETASDMSNLSSTVLENTTVNNGVNNEAEEAATIDDDHPYNDDEVVGGVLDIVCVLWMVRNRELSNPENEQYRAVLEKKSGRWLTLFFKQFRGTPVCGTVVYLASFLPERVVAPVASYCLARIKEEDNWKTHVDCLCNWRKGDSLLEVITQGIKAGMGKKKVGKGVRFEETQSKDVQLKLSVMLLEYLLSHHANRTILVTKNRAMLDECLELCLSVQQVIEQKIGFTVDEDSCTNKELAKIVALAGQLIVILHTDTALARLEELLAWSDRELVPVLMGPLENNSQHTQRTRSQVSLCEQVLSSMCELTVSCLSLGLADMEFTMKVLDWAVQLLHTGGAGQVGGVIQLLGEAATVASLGKGEGWEVLYQEKVPVCFAKLLSWLTNMGDKLDEVEGGISKLKKGVLALMKVYSKKKKDQGSWEDVVEVMVAAIVSLLKKKVMAVGEVVLPGTVGDLGNISSILVDVIVKQGGGEILGSALMNILREPEDLSVGGMAGAIVSLVSIVQCANRADVLDMIDKVIDEEIEKEEEEGERMGERELLGEVKAACMEARGRLLLQVS